MSDDAADVAQRYHEAVAAGDRDGVFGLLSEDIEFVTVDGPLDLDEVYRGHEGMRRFFRDWLGAWEPGGYAWDLTETESNGDRVFAAARERARAPASGAEVEQRWFQVQTVRNGRIARWEMFLDREAARRAAGLAE